MVLENQGEYDSQWAAICSIVPKIGCTPETLRVWCTTSMSGIPGAVMVDSPPLNVSV
ncbi:hypothetical protein AI2959V1_1256 [Escherichia coli]|nr:putative transposase OrfA protein of insertion sequence [Escherichia coli M718]ELG51303.1 hypothetical protein A1Y1_02125 [Escherichia coli KTE115]CAF2913884.1 hypothetical protein AI2959V1_1256 [Escherichia coli]CAH6678617.1 hypothetical protein AI2959V1_1256 [Escherichia coli]